MGKVYSMSALYVLEYSHLGSHCIVMKIPTLSILNICLEDTRSSLYLKIDLRLSSIFLQCTPGTVRLKPNLPLKTIYLQGSDPGIERPKLNLYWQTTFLQSNQDNPPQLPHFCSVLQGTIGRKNLSL